MRFTVSLAILIAAALAAIGLSFWLVRRWIPNAAEKERRRRLQIHLRGRMGDAVITDVSDSNLYYSYAVRGVEYTASQDVSTLEHMLPADPARLVGSVTLKFLPNDPFNSIVVCEEWAGFRQQDAPVLLKGA
ncbi:MAG TPA: hypothetical protein VMZ52_01795 [Bryobacteraceae bacterium]|nr:hypothetical protein [Bryobacteraceae bacterium]